MRLKVLACETLFREIHAAAAASPHVCDVKFLPRECHDDLPLMKRVLQEEIDRTGPCGRTSSEPGVRCPACSETPYDAILLAMGLCGNTTLGLRARAVPLVLPKVHDCSGLLLGGNSRYLAEETRTVFYHQGAVERLGAARVDAVPRRFGLGRSLAEYIRDYGEENGRYVYETEYAFTRRNDRALFLRYGPASCPTAQRCHDDVATHVSQFGWRVEPVEIDLTLARRLLNAEWDDEVFAIVQPGGVVDLAVSVDGSIMERDSGAGVQNAERPASVCR